MGVIDPAKVVRTALLDAASGASILITTEAAVATLPRRAPGAAQRLAALVRRQPA